MAKKKKGAGGIVTNNPDEFVAGGLADDFTGTIVKARYRPWNYGKAEFDYFLAVELEIEPDDDSGMEDNVHSFYKATSDLDSFWPGDSDGEPVDIDGWDEEDVEEVEGTTAVRVGDKEALGKNTNWAFWLTQIAKAGFAKHRQFSGHLDRDLEGLTCHFNRIPQPTRKGLDQAEGKKYDILVVTEIIEDTAGGGKKGKKSKKGKGADAETVKKKAKAAKAAEEEADEDEDDDEDGEDEFASRVETIAAGLLGDGSMTRQKMATKVIKKLKGAEKTAAMELLGDDDWVADEDRPWSFNAKTDTLVGAEADEDDDDDEDEDDED